MSRGALSERREPPLPLPIARLMKDLLAPDGDLLRVDEVTDAHAWAEDLRLFCGWTPAGEALSMAFIDGEPPWVFGGALGLDALGQVLVHARGALPGGLSPADLALAVRRLTVSPTGLLASPALADLSISPAPGWLGGDAAAQARARAALCQAPVWHDLGQGRFLLRFLYWTPAGGVELWDVVGDPARLLAAETAVAAPPGSFAWPFC